MNPFDSYSTRAEELDLLLGELAHHPTLTDHHCLALIEAFVRTWAEQGSPPRLELAVQPSLEQGTSLLISRLLQKLREVNELARTTEGDIGLLLPEEGGEEAASKAATLLDDVLALALIDHYGVPPALKTTARAVLDEVASEQDLLFCLDRRRRATATLAAKLGLAEPALQAFLWVDLGELYDLPYELAVADHAALLQKFPRLDRRLRLLERSEELRSLLAARNLSPGPALSPAELSAAADQVHSWDELENTVLGMPWQQIPERHLADRLVLLATMAVAAVESRQRRLLRERTAPQEPRFADRPQELDLDALELSLLQFRASLAPLVLIDHPELHLEWYAARVGDHSFMLRFSHDTVITEVKLEVGNHTFTGHGLGEVRFTLSDPPESLYGQEVTLTLVRHGEGGTMSGRFSLPKPEFPR